MIGPVETRAQRIREALEAALQPDRMVLVDESHRHVGHAGARDGRGHFALTVVSGKFSGLAPIARHRLVYGAVAELMQTDIHALSIQALTPEDDAQLEKSS